MFILFKVDNCTQRPGLETDHSAKLPKHNSSISLLWNPKVCIQYCWFMSIIKYALRKTLLTRYKISTVAQTDINTKNLSQHQYCFGIWARQGAMWDSRIFCNTLHFAIKDNCMLLLQVPMAACFSSSSALSSLGYKPYSARKHLPFQKVTRMRQQSTDTRQKLHQYMKHWSVTSLVNYTKFLL